MALEARGPGKDELRRVLLERRRAVPASERAVDAEALAAGLAEVVAGFPDPLCLHVPIGPEPGAVAADSPDSSPDDAVAVPSLLLAAVRLGRRVLLPVVVGAAPLDWAEYSAEHPLVPARWGLSEPSGPRLGPSAVRDAGLVLVPALAVDTRGARLGRGGGHYDRSLPLAGDATALVAVVRDEEFLDAPLPDEPHDVRMGAVWRPRGGLARTSG